MTKNSKSSKKSATAPKKITKLPATGKVHSIVRELDKGSTSAAGKQRSVVALNNKEEWEKLWTSHGSNHRPAPQCPKIDFRKHTVLAAFMGHKSSGGYGIKIESVRDDGTNLVVSVKESFPSGMSTMAITSPYHLIVTEKSNKPLKIEWTQ
ncbi:MAG: protease complex subunit PrcB family protein [Candidatus Obscuribacterales bacterium]|nr:protease complex subunit PrcB family protein [Candidatus Obscuribacterales bacterium]